MVSVFGGKQSSILLPKCVESQTFKNHVQCICNSHTTIMCAQLASPGNLLPLSKTTQVQLATIWPLASMHVATM